MHVLFDGLTASKELKKTFASHGIRISTARNLEELISSHLKPDLALFRLKTKTDLEKATKLRGHFPKIWLALVVGDQELNETDLFTSLLNFTAKDSVWHTDTWEKLLWFSIQEITRVQKLQKELTGLGLEIEASEHSTHSLVQKIEKDLAIAEKIQEKLVRSPTPQISGLEIVTKYIAAPGLGGDYFELFEIEEGRQLGILLVDSETHGLIAALLSALVKLKTHDFKSRFDSATSFLQYLEKELLENTNGALNKISIFFGLFDRSTFELDWISKGPLFPILWRENNQIPLKRSSSETLLSLIPGDRIFLCSNGLFRVIGNEETLLEIFSSLEAPLSLNLLKNVLMGKIDAYTEHTPLEDDITLIEIGINPKTLFLKKPREDYPR